MPVSNGGSSGSASPAESGAKSPALSQADQVKASTPSGEAMGLTPEKTEDERSPFGRDIFKERKEAFERLEADKKRRLEAEQSGLGRWSERVRPQNPIIIPEGELEHMPTPEEIDRARQEAKSGQRAYHTGSPSKTKEELEDLIARFEGSRDNASSPDARKTYEEYLARYKAELEALNEAAAREATPAATPVEPGTGASTTEADSSATVIPAEGDTPVTATGGAGGGGEHNPPPTATAGTPEDPGHNDAERLVGAEFSPRLNPNLEWDPRIAEECPLRNEQLEKLPPVEKVLKDLAKWYELRKRNYDAAFNPIELKKYAINISYLKERVNTAELGEGLTMAEGIKGLRDEVAGFINQIKLDQQVIIQQSQELERRVLGTTQPNGSYVQDQDKVTMFQDRFNVLQADWLATHGSDPQSDPEVLALLRLQTLVGLVEDIIPGPDGNPVANPLSREIHQLLSAVDANVKAKTSFENSLEQNFLIAQTLIRLRPGATPYEQLAETVERLQKEVLGTFQQETQTIDGQQVPVEKWEQNQKMFERFHEEGGNFSNDLVYILNILEEILPGDRLDRELILKRIQEARTALVHHPYLKLQEFMEERDGIVGEIVKSAVVLPETKGESEEKPLPPLPDESFDQLLTIWRDKENKTQYEREEAAEKITVYLKYAERCELLDTSELELGHRIGQLRNEKQETNPHKTGGGVLINGNLSIADEKRITELKDLGVPLDELEEYVTGKKAYQFGPQLQALLRNLEIYDDETAQLGADFNKFKGLIKFYTEEGGPQLTDFVGATVKPGEIKRYQGIHPPIEGLWSWQKYLEEDGKRKAAGKKLWEPSGAGYYYIYAETPQEFFATIREHLKFIKSGAVKRDPQSLLQEIEYFGKAVASFGQLASGKNRYGLDVKELRRQYETEALSHLAEMFSRGYNWKAKAAIYARFNEIFEGMDHWDTSTRLVDGLAYRAGMLHERPEFELMHRGATPFGLMEGETHGILFINRAMREYMAKMLVGEVISDVYTFEGIGVTIVGDGQIYDKEKKIWVPVNGKDLNLKALGFDQNNERHSDERCYVGKTEELLPRLRIYADEKYALDRWIEAHTKEQQFSKEFRAELRERRASLKEKALTPAEYEALRIRDIKSRISGEGTKIPAHDWKAFYGRTLKGDGSVLSLKERSDYFEALGKARDAVEVYMQLSSMTGEKTQLGGPSLLGRALDRNDRPIHEGTGQFEVIDKGTANERTVWQEIAKADEIPMWMGESFVQYAMNIAKRKVTKYNADLDVQIQKVDRAQLGWEDKVKALKAKKLIRSSDSYKIFMDKVKWDAVEALYNDGWLAKLRDYIIETNERGELITENGVLDHGANSLVAKKGLWQGIVRDDVHTKVTLKARKDQKGEYVPLEDEFLTIEDGQIVDTKSKAVNVVYTSHHVLGMYADANYFANQKEKHNEFQRQTVWEESQKLIRGEISLEQASYPARMRAIVDPTGERILPFRFKQQGGEEAIVLSAFEESYVDHFHAKRALSIQFQYRTEFGVPNYDGADKRLQYPQQLGASNPDRWNPRAEWMGPRMVTIEDSFTRRLGFTKFYQVASAIKGGYWGSRVRDQESLDGPLLNALAKAGEIQGKLNGYAFGMEKEGGLHEPGFFEKPFRSGELLEILDSYNVEGSVVSLLKTGLFSEYMPPGSERSYLTFHGDRGLENQRKFLENIQQRLPTFRDFFETLKDASENATAQGAWDLRYVELAEFDRDDTGQILFRTVGKYDGTAHEVFSQKTIPSFRMVWTQDKKGTRGLKPSKNSGRARELVSVMGNDVIRYLTEPELDIAITPFTGKRLMGAPKEYEQQRRYLELLDKVYLKTSWLDPDDQQMFPNVHYITVAEFLLGKWRRR